jgi:hypothetical protein
MRKIRKMRKYTTLSDLEQKRHESCAHRLEYHPELRAIAIRAHKEQNYGIGQTLQQFVGAVMSRATKSMITARSVAGRVVE